MDSDKRTIGAVPASWSGLDWQQLTACWRVKMRYGGNAGVARTAALLELCRLVPAGRGCHSGPTGEVLYTLRDHEGNLWQVTPRELSQAAMKAMRWFDYPYGDPGEPEQKDEKGKVIKEGRDPVRGYVGPMHDALQLPLETLKVHGKVFALPQVACNNLTWQQYRSLQAIVPQLFSGDASDGEASGLQARFLAHCLVPRSFALLDTAGGSMRVRPHWEYRYNASQADGLVTWWQRHGDETVFHVCFQAYQTALVYYATVHPTLFSDSGRKDVMHDALQGEVGTINSVMKYQGYSDPQQVYDTNLPIILDTLDTMAKEAKEIEKMNAKMRRK